MKVPLTPAEAWHPLPTSAWNPEAAAHLLRRAAWTAQPAEVERATREGLAATLDRLFPAEPPFQSKPVSVSRAEETAAGQMRKIQQMSQASADERIRTQREIQERARQAIDGTTSSSL